MPNFEGNRGTKTILGNSQFISEEQGNRYLSPLGASIYVPRIAATLTFVIKHTTIEVLLQKYNEKQIEYFLTYHCKELC